MNGLILNGFKYFLRFYMDKLAYKKMVFMWATKWISLNHNMHARIPDQYITG
jgi:hypothetical protein